MQLNIIYLLCEDSLSEVVMRKMVKEILSENEIYLYSLEKRGKGYIKSRINGINDSSPVTTFFVLADLDQIVCAPILINQWFKRKIRKKLIFRVVVREIEAWLLADVVGFARYLKLSESYLTKKIGNPEELRYAKEKLISLVDKCKISELKTDIVKKQRTGYKQGSGYNARLAEFVENYWNLQHARAKSRSLEKACIALENLRS
ncbi:MAG: hypothetical protein SCK70_09755 [bacterium]|nr:hypothetical protein [bacterium]